ncbi:hypothetical protein [Emticicia fluvialis]|uniref:hypothetical protein n=1 Tax=Emticicia fluvialis TaxID=2974474 RepID=UPI0021658955|nr:hypothetical protein [Emticicia fluvialis]
MAGGICLSESIRMVSYIYKGCGISISSELPLPELVPGDATPADLSIRIGPVPDQPTAQVTEIGPGYMASAHEYIFRLPNVAGYYARDGKEIWIDPAKNADAESIRHFLLNQVLPQILFQRNLIPLKASGIIYNNQVVLFVGRSGAGKSTLLASLKQRGYQVFTDDMCVMRHNAKREIEILAGYATIKLWQDAYKILQLGKPDESMRIRPQLPKYNTFIHDEFLSYPYQAATTIFLLEATIQKSAYTAGVSYASLFKAHTDSLHGKSFNKRQLVFNVLSNFLKNKTGYRIRRSVHQDSIDEMVKFIETKIC